MKKRYIILIIVVILILIVTMATMMYTSIKNQEKDYEIEKVGEYNYFILKQNNQYGIIDKHGDKIIEPQYDEIVIPNPEKPVFVCYESENTKILNDKNEQILQNYDKPEAIRLKNIASDLMYEKSVLKYQKEGKYGLVDFNGKMLTEAVFDEIDSLQYKEGELLVKQNEKYGIINIKGKELIKPQYDQITADGYYTEENGYKYSGYIVGNKTEEGYRYGYINYETEKILDIEYNEITRINNEYFVCAKNGQYGVNKNAQNIIENEYQSIRYDETNNLFVVEKSGKYGIKNLEGKEIVPLKYTQIDITGIYIYAQNDQGVTVYNTDGTQANVDSNIVILNTDSEKYRITINNNDQQTKYGVSNASGKQLIEEKYNYIEYLYDNYFMASYENGKLGVLDDKENVKIELNNDSIQKVEGTGLIQTTLGQVTTLYTKDLEKICEMQNAIVSVIDDENVKIYNETETKYFDNKGNELTNKQVYPNNELYVLIRDGKYGFWDKDGNLVVECKYDKAYELNQYGYAAVKKDDLWGVIDSNGKEIVTPTYELEETLEPSFIRTIL